MAYAFDPTGSALQNQVIGATLALSKIPASAYHFAMFDFGPFYADSIRIKHTALNGAERILEREIDWIPGFQYKSATQRANRHIVAAVKLIDITLTGTLTVTAQALGGVYQPALSQIQTVRTLETRDPEFTTWESVCSAKNIALTEFPVVDHPYNMVVSDDVRRVVDALAGIGLVVQLRPSLLTTPNASAFVPTPAEIGLGKVGNYPVASTAEAQEGISETTYMTPKATSEAVTARVESALLANGYLYPIAYVAGLQVSSVNRLYLYDGSVYSPRPSALPFTTNGAFESEKFSRVRALEHKAWKSWRYTVTGNEARDAAGAIIVSTEQPMRVAVKTRMTINSVNEPIYGVDYHLDATTLHLRYPVGAGDVVELFWRESTEETPAPKNYYKAFSVISGQVTYTLTNIAGVELTDLRFLINDWTVLTRGVDYTFDAPGASSVNVTITFPLSLGDVIEVMPIDATPSLGRLNVRNLFYVARSGQ